MRTLAVVTLLAGAPLISQSATPRYEVKRAPSPPTIDGKLAWTRASPPIVLQFLWVSSRRTFSGARGGFPHA